MLILFTCVVTLFLSIPIITAIDVSVSGLLLTPMYFICSWLFCFFDAEFLTSTILTVYLGAVTIISLLITTTFKINTQSNLFIFNVYFSLLFIFSVIMFSIKPHNTLKLNNNFIIIENTLLSEYGGYTDIEEVGFFLYNLYFPITLVCFILLFVAMLVIYRILK